jgi:hypothetical protein
MKRTVFSNTHEPKVNLEKKWYGVIDYVDAPSRIATYTTKQRSEAVAIFEEEARLSGGTLCTVGVFK